MSLSRACPGTSAAGISPGPAFSADGHTLFVNIQSPGFTLAVTGPWGRPSNADM
jgi:secreted PhoX family phosphatase